MFFDLDLEDFSVQSILNEADDNDTESFQLGSLEADANGAMDALNGDDITTQEKESPGGDNNQDNNAEEPANEEDGREDQGNDDAEDNTTEDFQLDDNLGSDDTEETSESGEDASGEVPTEDSSMDTGDTGQDNNDETTKKYILIDQYKNMIDSISKLLDSIESLALRESFTDKEKDKNESDFSDDYSYIVKELTDLKRNSIFTLINKFSAFDYQKLLTLFYYYQEKLDDITDLFQNILSRIEKETSN